MNNAFNITKANIEVYWIRPKGHNSGWADISIDEGETSGRVSIASDYGGWSYYWGACGSGFKQFLIDLDIDYAAGKFGEGSYFDVETTVRGIRKDILKERKEGYLEQEEARDLMELTDDLVDLRTADAFASVVYRSNIMKLYDTGPDMSTKISPSFQRFWETTWQAFIVEF